MQNSSKKGDQPIDKRLEDTLGKFSVQYETLREHATKVQRDVTPGAVAVDGGLLTDHGPDHIQTVIDRASQLSSTERCDLTNYEVFLLLAAIHLHDVGNIHGRKAHQLTANDVADWLGSSISTDAIVRRTVIQIASAHTAGDSPDKDTISKLSPEQYILNHRVRPRLLAAILRFADELADDRSRASAYLHQTSQVPHSSQVFHAFAYALHSVNINHGTREIELHFDMQTDDAVRKFGKQDTEVYLLDEILSRSVKLHLERKYAMSFIHDWISIDAIRVFIEVYGEGLNPVEKLGYWIAEHGYPDEPEAGVYALAPELSNYKDWDGDKVTGAALADRISEKKNEPTTY